MKEKRIDRLMNSYKKNHNWSTWFKLRNERVELLKRGL